MFIIDYEIASECNIIGIIEEYIDKNKNLSIRFSPLTFKTDNDGLYRYLIRITYYNQENNAHISNLLKFVPTRNIDNLLALLAVYFGCRFFKISYSNDNNEYEYIHSFTYIKCYKEFLPTIFDVHQEDKLKHFQRDRIFDNKLCEFLNIFNELEFKECERIIRSFNHYSGAIQSVGMNMNNYSYNGYGEQNEHI